MTQILDLKDLMNLDFKVLKIDFNVSINKNELLGVCVDFFRVLWADKENDY